MRQLLCCFLLFFISLLFLIPSISYAQIEVTTIADSGPGSLRQAVIDAVDDDVITFNLPGPPPNTIVLTSGEILIDKALIITGPGVNHLTISGNDNSRIFRVDNGSPAGFTTVSISGMRIVDGNESSAGISPITSGTRGGGPPPTVSSDGGAIQNFENLTLQDCEVSDSEADSATGGGGIYNGPDATLTIDSCIISNNSYTGPTEGRGGGIYNDDGATLTFTNSSLIGNTASGSSSGFGGGLYNGSLSRVIFRDCTISDNMVLGSATAGGEAGGGGVYTSEGGGAAFPGLDFDRCSIVRNLAEAAEARGGGMYHEQTMNTTLDIRLLNVTISENMALTNVAGAFGGGIMNQGGEFRIVNSTIVFNIAAPNNATGSGFSDGGGIFVADTGTLAVGVVRLKNTIVASNSLTLPPMSITDPELNSIPFDITTRGTAPPAPNCKEEQFPSNTAEIIIGLNNLSDITQFGDACGVPEMFNPDFDTSTMIGPLQDNGGGRLTHSLLVTGSPSNPAIDGIPDGDCNDNIFQSRSIDVAPRGGGSLPIPVDERGIPRPFNWTGTPDAMCDIGAFELFPQATLIVEKVTNPTGGSGFQFLGTTPGSFPALCDLDGIFSLSDGDSTNACLLNAESYTVEETDAAGLTLSNIDCQGTSSFTTDATSFTYTIGIPEHLQVVTCTFTNSGTFTLTTAVQGAGTGGIASTNPGIDCNSMGTMDCTEDYLAGTMVTLTATPDPGSTFTGWSGDAACTGTPTDPVLSLTMNSDISCIATFDLMPVMLDVTIQGTGDGGVLSTNPGIDCNSMGTMGCDQTYGLGTMVTLTATAVSGSIFDGWSGNAACTGDPMNPVLMLDMNMDISCIATFIIAPPTAVTLDVIIQGSGTCTVTSEPPNLINCPGDCAETFALPGTTVTLTATPDPSSIFIDWTGDCNDLNPETSITVNQDSTCIATCELNEFVLNPVFPALDDNINFISAEAATPGGNVAFAWAKKTGSLTIGGRVCNGSSIGLNNPKLLAMSRANEFGIATYVFYIPTFNDLNFEIQLQSIDIETCRTSNIVPQIIRKDESG